MTILEMIAEWRRGCSIGGPAAYPPSDSPCDCFECTEGLVDAIEAKERRLPELKLLERRKSEECSCPEEVWLVGNVECTIHEEADGSCHVIMDNGDAQSEMEFSNVGKLDDARDLLLGWARANLYAMRGWG